MVHTEKMTALMRRRKYTLNSFVGAQAAISLKNMCFEKSPFRCVGCLVAPLPAADAATARALKSVVNRCRGKKGTRCNVVHTEDDLRMHTHTVYLPLLFLLP